VIYLYPALLHMRLASARTRACVTGPPGSVVVILLTGGPHATKVSSMCCVVLYFGVVSDIINISSLFCCPLVVVCQTAVEGVECSGHGVCYTMAEFAASDAISAPTVYGSNVSVRESIAWDHDVMKTCVCNSSWDVGLEADMYQLAEYFEPDCSQSKSVLLLNSLVLLLHLILCLPLFCFV